MHRYFLFFLFIPGSVVGQISENWSDTFFSSNPEWKGDTCKYSIDDNTHILSLNAESVSSEACIYTSSYSIDNASWEFSVQFDFNPSSSNYCKIYLCGNQSEINDQLTGYYVMVGNKEDEVSLYRIDGENCTEIIDGTDKILDQAKNEVKIKVTRSNDGTWTLYSKVSDEEYNTEGTVTDNTYVSSSYFLIYCKYSKSRATKFHFGPIEISGEAYVDNESPYLKEFQITDDRHILLHFNESLDTSSISVSNFRIQPQNIIPKKLNFEQKKIELYLPTALENTAKGYLYITKIPDLSNNILSDTTVTFQFYNHKRGEIIFNEIMYDPTPTINQYLEEYIELYNNSDHPISLDNWRLSVNDKQIYLLSDTIESFSYLILSENDSIYTQNNSSTRYMTLPSLPALRNSGSTIYLINEDNAICDAIQYPLYPLPDPEKDDGGWSLERIDPDNLETSGFNWDYSINEDGGTPGFLNSINQTNEDIYPPSIKKLLYIDDNTFTVFFNEMLDTSSVHANNLISESDLNITEVELDTVFLSQLTFHLKRSIPKRIAISLEFNDSICDMAGNIFTDKENWKIGSPEEIDTFDISLNEILFNPVSYGEDFVEIYNRSKKIFLLSDLYINNLSKNDSNELSLLETENKLLFPGDYYVFTGDTITLSNLHSNINRRNISECDLPSLDDESGNITICTVNQNIIDNFEYNEEVHFQLLSATDGVSLEKINYNYDSNDIENWYSAATIFDYSTPTRENSQYKSDSDSEDQEWIWTECKEFSPDGDGYKDNLQIEYQLSSPGWTGHMAIYDRYGTEIKTLLNNGLTGTSGTIEWDGTSNNGKIVKKGIYIVYADFVNPNGISQQKKITAFLTSSNGL